MTALTVWKFDSSAGAGQGGLIESTTQVEGDVRFEKDDLYLRADVDVTLDTLGGVTPTMYPPEWAMVQYAPGSLRLRLSVTSPNFNVEDWDAWNNYLPTFSVMFNGASPGRLLGGQVGWALDDATEVFAYGGLDLDYCTLADPECAFADAPPIAGLGIDVPRAHATHGLGIQLRHDARPLAIRRHRHTLDLARDHVVAPRRHRISAAIQFSPHSSR